jgi:DNA-directed RNA polymerase specialized sigma24 family protein
MSTDRAEPARLTKPMERGEQGRVSSGDWKGEAFRRTLLGIVRKRVPERDVEDIVQATLTEALSPTAPTDEAALQRWLIGVARHKIVDRHRRGQKESFEVPELHDDSPPTSARDLVRWAESALPAEGEEPQRTLEWMIREGDGEKLESIAASEKIPAPRIRKRVSRLRRHLRAEWKKELALLAALGVAATLIWIVRRDSREPVAHDRIVPAPSEVIPSPELRARQIREDALAACDKSEWAACIDGLDRAKEIDPAGDAEPRVGLARAAASAALNPPAPAPLPTIAPSSLAPSPPPRSVPTSTPTPFPSDFESAPAPRKPSGSSKKAPTSGFLPK